MKKLLRIKKIILFLIMLIFCIKIDASANDDNILKNIINTFLMPILMKQKNNISEFIKKQSKRDQEALKNNPLFAYFLYKAENYYKNNREAKDSPLQLFSQIIFELNKYKNMSDKLCMGVKNFDSIISYADACLKNEKDGKVFLALQNFFNQHTREHAEALCQALMIKDKTQIGYLLSFMEKIKIIFQNIYLEDYEPIISLKHSISRKNRKRISLKNQLTPGLKVYYKIDQDGNLTQIDEKTTNINKIVSSVIKYDSQKIHSTNVNAWDIEIPRDAHILGNQSAIFSYIDDQFNKIEELKIHYPDKEFGLALTQAQNQLYCSELDEIEFPLLEAREFSSKNIYFLDFDGINGSMSDNDIRTISLLNSLLQDDHKDIGREGQGEKALSKKVLVILYDPYSNKEFSAAKRIKKCLEQPAFINYINNKNCNLRFINIVSDESTEAKEVYYKEEGFCRYNIMGLKKNNFTGETELDILDVCESNKIIDIAKEKTIKSFLLHYQDDNTHGMGLVESDTKIKFLINLFADNIVKKLFEAHYKGNVNNFIFDDSMIDEALKKIFEKIFENNSRNYKIKNVNNSTDEVAQIIEIILQKYYPVKIKYISGEYNEKLHKKLKIKKLEIRKNDDFITKHIAGVLYESNIFYDTREIVKLVFDDIYKNSRKYYLENNIAEIINNKGPNWEQEIAKHDEILAKKNVEIICDKHLYRYSQTRNTPVTKNLIMLRGSKIPEDYKKKLIDLGIIKASEKKEHLIYRQAFKEKLDKDSFGDEIDLTKLDNDIKAFEEGVAKIMGPSGENRDGIMYELIRVTNMNTEGSPRSNDFPEEVNIELKRLFESCTKKKFDQKILTRYFSHKDQSTIMLQGGGGGGKTMALDIIAKLIHLTVDKVYGSQKASSIYIIKINGGIQNSYKAGIHASTDKLTEVGDLAAYYGVQVIYQFDEFTIEAVKEEEKRESINNIPPEIFKRLSNNLTKNGHIMEFATNRTCSLDGAVKRRMMIYYIGDVPRDTVYNTLKDDTFSDIDNSIKDKYFYAKEIMQSKNASMKAVTMHKIKNAIVDVKDIITRYENQYIDRNTKQEGIILYANWLIDHNTGSSWLGYVQYLQKNFDSLKRKENLVPAEKVKGDAYYNGENVLKRGIKVVGSFLLEAYTKIPGLGKMLEPVFFNPDYVKYAETEQGKKLYQKKTQGAFEFFKSAYQEESLLNLKKNDSYNNALRLYLSLDKDNSMQSEERYRINSILYGLMHECELQGVGKNEYEKVKINKLRKNNENHQIKEKLKFVIRDFSESLDCKEANENRLACVYEILDNFKKRMSGIWQEDVHTQFLLEHPFSEDARSNRIKETIKLILLDYEIEKKKKETNALFASMKNNFSLSEEKYFLLNASRRFFDDGGGIANWLSNCKKIYAKNDFIDKDHEKEFQEFSTNYKIFNVATEERLYRRVNLFTVGNKKRNGMFFILFQVAYNKMDSVIDIGKASRILDSIIMTYENGSIDEKDAIDEEKYMKNYVMQLNKEEVELQEPIIMLNFVVQATKNNGLASFLSEHTSWICSRMYNIQKKDVSNKQEIEKRIADKESILTKYSENHKHYKSFFDHIEHNKKELKGLYKAYVSLDNDTKSLFLLDLIKIGEGRVPNTPAAKTFCKKLLKRPSTPLTEDENNHNANQVVDSLVDKNQKVTTDRIEKINDLIAAYENKEKSATFKNISLALRKVIDGTLQA